METLLDSLLNSWEHWGDLHSESQLLAQELGDSEAQTQDLQPHILRLMQAWMNNDDNIRIDIQLNYHKSPSKYNLETLKFIKQFVQI